MESTDKSKLLNNAQQLSYSSLSNAAMSVDLNSSNFNDDNTANNSLNLSVVTDGTNHETLENDKQSPPSATNVTNIKMTDTGSQLIGENEHGEHNAKSTVKKGGLSVWTFGIMIFVMTSGGPFGIEACVRSGGVLLTLIGLTLIPLFYSLPQSLMCAELSSMMPSNHGYIVWVYRGYVNDFFGQFVGFINALNAIAGTGTDLPIYAVVGVEYVKRLFSSNLAIELSYIESYAIKFMIVVCAGILNVMNIELVGTVSVIFTIIILVPFILGWAYSLPNTNFESWTQGTPDGTYNIGLFLSTLLWLHGGWDVMGCLAGEVGFAGKKFFYSFAIAMILDYFGYVLPLLGALTEGKSQWENAYLLEAYNKIIPRIGYIIAIGGICSNFGLYMVELAAHSRSLWAISQPSITIKTNAKLMIKNSNEQKEKHLTENQSEPSETVNNDVVTFDQHYQHIRIDVLPEYLFGRIWNRTGSPAAAIIFITFVNCILISFDFDILVETSIFIRCFTWLFEFFAFLRLRYTEPNAERPFKSPGGLIGAWIVTLTKLCVILAVFIGTACSEPVVFLIFLGFNFLCVMWYFIRKWQWSQEKYAKFTSEMKNDSHFGESATNTV